MIKTHEQENNKHGNKLNLVIHKSNQNWLQEIELSQKARRQHLQSLLNQLGMAMRPKPAGPDPVLTGKLEFRVRFEFSSTTKVWFGVKDEIINTLPKPVPLIINL